MVLPIDISTQTHTTVRGMSSFNCQRCGRCCKEIGIPWSELDPQLVADHLQVDLQRFLDAHGFVVNPQSGEIEHPEPGVTPCPFLTYDWEKPLCRIYPVRPWVCQGYPGPGMVCRGGRQRCQQT
jgi:Fe-S-cluster containining protein